MSIYTTAQTVIATLFFKKRFLLLIILVIIAILVGFAWYFSRDVDPIGHLISSEKLLVSGTQNGVTYAANEEYYYALLPEKYYKIPKKGSSCKNASPNDFATWCKEWSTPNNY